MWCLGPQCHAYCVIRGTAECRPIKTASYCMLTVAGAHNAKSAGPRSELWTLFQAHWSELAGEGCLYIMLCPNRYWHALRPSPARLVWWRTATHPAISLLLPSFTHSFSLSSCSVLLFFHYFTVWVPFIVLLLPTHSLTSLSFLSFPFHTFIN